MTYAASITGQMTSHEPDKTGRLSDGRFVPGSRGNPNGRPVGSKNKATLAAETILDGEAEALTRKAVELALNGDASAMRICMERLVPARRDRPISVNLPRVETLSDAARAMSFLVGAVTCGDLTPSEADAVAKLLSYFSTALENADFETRLSALESKTLK